MLVNNNVFFEQLHDIICICYVIQSTTGFIHMKLEEEPPMFSKLKINIPLRNAVTKLVVSNDVMLIAMASNTVLRVDLRQQDKIEGKSIGSCKKMYAVLNTNFLFTLI